MSTKLIDLDKLTTARVTIEWCIYVFIYLIALYENIYNFFLFKNILLRHKLEKFITTGHKSCGYVVTRSILVYGSYLLKQTNNKFLIKNIRFTH